MRAAIYAGVRAMGETVEPGRGLRVGRVVEVSVDPLQSRLLYFSTSSSQEPDVVIRGYR